MKITNKHVGQSVGLDKSRSQGLEKSLGGGLNKSDGVGASKSAKVDLSSRAQTMQKAKDIASSQSVDEAKIARLQKLIDAGEYKVDAKAVADRLVDEHLATS